MITINLKFEGQNSKVVLGMYADSEMANDIDRVSFSLCSADERLFSCAIGRCRLVEAWVHPRSAEVTLDLPGDDEALKENALEAYFSSFADYIRPALLGLQSRGMGRYEFKLTGYAYEELQPSLIA